MKKESDFQKRLKKKIEALFPSAIVMKTDAGQIQGFPDLIILYNDKWATLECKRSENEPKRPNQQFYVDKLNDLSFSAFVYPENEQEVLDALQQTFRT